MVSMIRGIQYRTQSAIRLTARGGCVCVCGGLLFQDLLWRVYGVYMWARLFGVGVVPQRDLHLTCILVPSIHIHMYIYVCVFTIHT